MKKLVTLFTLAIAMVASADVASQNVVGYNTVTIDKQWSIVAINFQQPGGANLGLQEAVPYVTGMTKGSAATLGDNIQIQNVAGGYDTYFMCNGTIGKASVPAADGKWVKNGESISSTNSIPVGKGAWYLRRGASDFTITIARPYSL